MYVPRVNSCTKHWLDTIWNTTFINHLVDWTIFLILVLIIPLKRERERERESKLHTFRKSTNPPQQCLNKIHQNKYLNNTKMSTFWIRKQKTFQTMKKTESNQKANNLIMKILKKNSNDGYIRRIVKKWFKVLLFLQKFFSELISQILCRLSLLLCLHFVSYFCFPYFTCRVTVCFKVV